MEVIDKNGKRVTRDGILQSGDALHVPIRMMDSANPALADAIALADAVKRAQAFDASKGVGHKPGYSMQDAGTAGNDAREARDARLVDAWKNPPSVKDTTALEQIAVVGCDATDAQLFAARDRSVTDRDARTRDAWKAA